MLILLAGVSLLYVSSRAGAESAGVMQGGEASAGRRALILWMPIALVALLAMWRNEPDVAMSVLLATSVGALSLGTGGVILTDFDARLLEATAAPSRRAWQFLVPAALLPLLAGLAGWFYWWHALIFAVEGAAILLVWNDRGGSEYSRPAVSSSIAPRRWLNLGLAVILAILGAVLCLNGTQGVTSELHLTTPRIV
ncbi:MAG TPA: hypothetical protein VMD30_02565, partial [Tepidisphaeraceae bacterium]|nr:hypothetical protein [Tepidisphaeraceae bacterium]